MFRERTTLVLGAGASLAYGFPSGAGLVAELIHYHKSQTFLEICHSAGITSNVLGQFCHDLEVAAPESIDLFLHNRRADFERIGKLAIAYCLIGYENEANTRQPKKELGPWYHLLANHLGKFKSELSQNQLCIVTFNYDRSLEYFLFTCFNSRFGLADDQAAELVRQFNIRHVYGKLGSLIWESGDGCFARDYSEAHEMLAVKKCAKRVRLIHDVEKGTDDELAAIRDSVQKADHVFMLGCGFHDENMALLGLPGTGQPINKDFHATCVGLTPPQETRVQKRWPGITLHNLNIDEVMTRLSAFHDIASA